MCFPASPDRCSTIYSRQKLRWDIAGGVSPEQVDALDMQEAEKLIDQCWPQSVKM